MDTTSNSPAHLTVEDCGHMFYGYKRWCLRGRGRGGIRSRRGSAVLRCVMLCDQCGPKYHLLQTCPGGFEHYTEGIVEGIEQGYLANCAGCKASLSMYLSSLSISFHDPKSQYTESHLYCLSSIIFSGDASSRRYWHPSFKSSPYPHLPLKFHSAQTAKRSHSIHVVHRFSIVSRAGQVCGVDSVSCTVGVCVGRMVSEYERN